MNATGKHMGHPETEEFVESCGNVFADLMVHQPDDELAKAQLAHAVRQEIRRRGLTQSRVASLVGTDQARVSDLMRGKLGGFTYDRLLRFLKALNMDVRITVAHAPTDQYATTMVVLG